MGHDSVVKVLLRINANMEVCWIHWFVGACAQLRRNYFARACSSAALACLPFQQSASSWQLLPTQTHAHAACCPTTPVQLGGPLLYWAARQGHADVIRGQLAAAGVDKEARGKASGAQAARELARQLHASCVVECGW